MTWSDEVYENRFSTAVARASAERRLRKKGLPVPVMSTADSGPVAAMVVVMSGLLAWQQYGAHVRSALARNPLVQQLRALVFGTRGSGPRQVSTAPKGGGSSSASKAGSKVTARRPAAGTAGPGALAPMAAAAAPATPAAAAAAAVGGRACLCRGGKARVMCWARCTYCSTSLRVGVNFRFEPHSIPMLVKGFFRLFGCLLPRRARVRRFPYSMSCLPCQDAAALCSLSHLPSRCTLVRQPAAFSQVHAHTCKPHSTGGHLTDLCSAPLLPASCRRWRELRRLPRPPPCVRRRRRRSLRPAPAPPQPQPPPPPTSLPAAARRRRAAPSGGGEGNVR